jgi:cell division protein ZapE
VRDVLAKADLKTEAGPVLPEFAPPPRFGHTSFDTYRPQHLSQTQARDEVQAFTLGVADVPEKPRFQWPWARTKDEQGRGLYLDGGFGVGKTHLLAAAYHACSSPKKAYLSFQELVYVIGTQGMPKAKISLGDYRLLCIDEFELDDPGNTLIVKTFLAHAFEQGAKVITTSNTPPEAQGQGRFNAEDFRREIQSIASRFKILRVEGPDYRKRDHLARFFTEQELQALIERENAAGPKVVLSWEEMLELLNEHHPIRYHGVLSQVGTLYVSGVRTIADQGNALRFVHFIDKLYDLQVKLRAAGDIGLDEVFHASYVRSAYAKKHYRCLSRLSELLEEDLPERPGVVPAAKQAAQ